MISAALEEVTELLYTRSIFSHSGHERVDTDLVKFLQDLNFRLPKIPEEEMRQEYILGVISYQFLAPILGINVEKEKKTFADYFTREHKLKDPLGVHFTVEGGDPNDIITLDSIVPAFQNKQIFQHKTPSGLRNNAYRQAETELGFLEHEWTEDQALITTGYFLLLSAFKLSITRLKERFDKAIEGQLHYVLMFPIDKEDD